MRSKVIGIAALVALIAAVAPVGVSAQAPTRYVDLMFDDVVVTSDIYGEAMNSKGELQPLGLDVYQPAGDTASGRGLYIWVHGGNFRVGNKSSSGPLNDYVRRGWVGISIDYRLRPELPGNAAIGAVTDPASLPAFIDETKDAQHDAQAAVRWARDHADDLGIDPNLIAMGGISAGAIISQMVAFNHEDPGSTGTPGVSSEIAAAVSHAGTYAPVLLGDAPRPGDPPIAIYHGTNDEQVPYPTAPIPCVLTLAVGNDCEYVTFVTENHKTMGTDLARDFLYRHVIGGGARTYTPVVADLDGSPVKVFTGAEPGPTDLGFTAGVVSTTDPDVVTANTLQLLRYALNALGIPPPF
ncbi:MAG: alpha/beta hydrolase fold domain-containing protein [Actinomycetota bacterium]